MTDLNHTYTPCKTDRNSKRKQNDCKQQRNSSAEVIKDASDSSRDISAQDKNEGAKRQKVGKSIDNPNPSNLVLNNYPRPDHFQQLEKLHKALNLVFTFCCTRKQLATKYDTIKSAVKGHINRELEIEEVAQIVSLRPSGLRLAYIDEAMLQVDLCGPEKHGNFRNGKNNVHNSQFDIYEDSLTSRRGHSSADEVLFFEFIDGDLKRQVKCKKTGEPINASRRMRKEDLIMPVFSQKQMLDLIKKRDNKFADAVTAFLSRCQTEGKDPVETIKKEAVSYIPEPSHTRKIKPALSNSLAKLNASIPKERKSIPEIIAELKESEFYTGQIVPDGHRVFDPQEAIYGNLNFKLSQNMVNALYNTKKITQFYSHQADAINSLHDGHHVIVATSTSSGKSLIYQIPVLHELELDPNIRAMYIFPTKALAQDQKRSLKEMVSFIKGLEEIIIDTFDGDTDMKDRNLIRDQGRIIFTNPDMLHITILPQEERWRSFLKYLKYIVIDEIHIYNGLFGSHVALIVRRLRRICAALGNRDIKFISCSATVANPSEHFKTIFGVENVKTIDFDGSPAGRKEFLCWNTPFKDPGDPSSGRGDITVEAAKLFCQLILRGVRVIAFCKVRKACEALVGAVKNELVILDRPECAARVMGYRGGYTPQDRRQIESQMFEGKLIGIVATSALELGVDIGSLDAVMSVGFPYTIANLRQQSGRAGRRNKDSLSILIGDSFPADQYYMQNPDEIFTKPNAALQVDLQNMLVLEGHIQCAAYELPINVDNDINYFSKVLKEIAEERLIKDDLGFYHCHDRFRPTPSKFVSIRDTEEDHFAIIDISHERNIVLEELEVSRAFFTIYDGGIFLHQGNTYLVKEFNPDRKIAKVELVRVDWTTQQRDFTDIDPIETEAIRGISGSISRAFYGKIRIKRTVYGFFKVDKRRRILDAVEIDNPPIIIFSKGMWLDVPKKALDILMKRRLDSAGAIHAAEHAILSLMPNFVISLPGDVRTECKVGLREFSKRQTSRKRPARLTFYDTKGGANGSGISTKAFEFVDLLLKQAVQRVEACHCFEGCVECVASELCKHSNEVMSKAGAEVILKSLLNIEIDLEKLPLGPESPDLPNTETIILAEPILPKGRMKVLEVDKKCEGDKNGAIGTFDEGYETKIKIEPQD